MEKEITTECKWQLKKKEKQRCQEKHLQLDKQNQRLQNVSQKQHETWN